MLFHNVTLAYEERRILRDINLSIPPGDFVFLIGASGSGKTSFIRSLVGLMKPRSGFILNNKKEDIYSLSPSKLLAYRRTIGVIFQDFKLLPKKTVYENVAFAMEVSGYTDAMIAKRVPEVLTQVGLLQKKKSYIEKLSGGELQRTAIARALIHDPDIIIGDEPTGNLDPRNAEEVIHLLKQLAEQGKTIIIATHDDRLVDQMKKRVLAFEDGILVSDTPIGTYSLPSHAR